MKLSKHKLIIFLVILLTLRVNTYSYSEKNYYPKREVWKPARGTDMNISHYVYHDMNRNGVYDIGDRPLVNFAIKMTRPDGSYVVRRSNLNGFTNFTNSALDGPVDIFEPGEYTFELIIPEGWEVTSNNTIQKIKWHKGQNERSSLIAEKVPEPIGVVQTPTIEGSIDNYNSEIEASYVSPSKQEHKLNINNDGSFKVYGEYGEYILKFKNKDISIERKVKLGTIPIKLSTIYFEKETSNKKNKKLIDFENITYSNIQKIPNGVANLNWKNLIVTDFLLYKGEGYINNRISGKYVAYNTSGQPVTISNPNGFDFYGGYFGVAWFNSAEGETLQVKAYRGDTLIDKQDLELSALGPFYFDANYKNITKLELKTKHYWQFVTDDLLIGLD